ncbi:hypothetical protein ICN10_00050 [Polynucleobacter sp. 86C-FISCH]|uniref:hypothetical protein n=1 Tax=Polynucleobacter sp. 86C-FISCH TaxID=2689101 RepID=UPI001C0BDEE9|nr:hypothetical protein [Polynucleobacter sp. 86C-FISCH]MBU3594790.1 hypothetical protein [Polynucleobacter sp. 86C-FISCH]
MQKTPLLFLGMIAFSFFQNAYAQDFYTQVVGGVLHGQVKKFSRTGEEGADGWVMYKASTLDPKSFQVLEYRYAINCRFHKAAIFNEASMENEPLTLAHPKSGFRSLEGGDLNEVLGPACKLHT